MTPELLTAIAELLDLRADDVANLTLDDVLELLQAAFDTAAEPDDEATPDLERLTALADASDGVREAIDAAATAEAEAQEEIEELRSRVRPTAAETEPTAEDAPEGEPDVGEEAAPEGEPAPEADEEVAEPIAASSPVVPMRRRRPAAHAPVPTDDGGGMFITAAGDVNGFSAGQRIRSFSELGQAFVDKVDALRGVRSGGKFKVATMHLQYPEERQLRKDEGDIAIKRKIDAVNSPQAIAAAGGLCAPVAVRYEFENVSVDDRPVRDSLTRFNAERGGINVPTSPIITAPDAGVGIITEAQDTAGSPTKACVTVTCPSYTEVDINAVYQCIKIGNFSKRTFPELFDQWWALAGALHARKAEGALLDGIGAIATNVTDGQNLSATRDFLESGIRFRAQRVSQHRMATNAMFDWVIPEWMISLIQADNVREHAGGPRDSYTITQAQIEGWLRSKYLNPVWYKDTETAEGMIYGAQLPQSGNAWNLAPVSYLYPTGSFLFLDGGELDLGVDIRDTTLIAANDVQAFSESFENIAFVGQVTPLEITHSLCVSGAGSLDIAITCPENS